MIREVKTISSIDAFDGGAITVKCAYEDMNKMTEHTVMVKRFHGKDSCTNIDGTDNKITVQGNLVFVEGVDGKMELDQDSQYSLKDAVDVFKVIFGETEPEG